VVCVFGQGKSLDSDLRINGKKVEAAFDYQRDLVQKSSAVVYGGSLSICYAVIVSENGYLLTKASELEGVDDLSVRIGRKKYVPEVVEYDTEWDVALLKIEAEGLQLLEWGDDEAVQGSWVVSNGSTSRSRRRVSVGIISAHTRKIIGAVPVVMGVALSDEKGEMLVTNITEGSGAEEAGLEKGDVLLEINGNSVQDRELLQDLLRMMEAGEIIDVLYRRGDKEMETKVKLRARHAFDKGPLDRNDQMSGKYSIRRDSFPRVLQHDIPLSRRSCGGPLLDLNGRCIGMNIARANRAESFAIPAEELRKISARMIESATQDVQKQE